MRARDLHNPLELRRLAYKAKRIPGMREVLHDVLLETFPAYEATLARAYREAASGAEKIIVFLPHRMVPRSQEWWAGSGRRPEKRRRLSPEMFFTILDNVTLGKEDTSTKALEARFFRPSGGAGTLPDTASFRTAVIVHRTRGYL